MATKSILDILRPALPYDISCAQIASLAPEELWSNNPHIACFIALRKCNRINWDAYLAEYPDVANAKMPAIEHFLRYGLFEGRKLRSYKNDHPQGYKNSCDVSIIIIVQNDELHIEHCINTVIGQSLTNIEIIIVDDASEDDSVNIIANIMQSDCRIRLVRHNFSKGIHVARKNGLAYASGKYIMFMSGSDFLAPNACEVAYGAIVNGYDAACFNVNFINATQCDESTIAQANKEFNGSKARVYRPGELLKSAFMDHALGYRICGKIFAAEPCKNAFAQMSNARLRCFCDIYEFVMLATQIRTIHKINNTVYFLNITSAYICGDVSEISIVGAIRELEIFSSIINICQSNLYNIFLPYIEQSFLQLVFQYIYKYANTATLITSLYNTCIQHFGALGTLLHVSKTYFEKWEQITNKFVLYQFNNRHDIIKCIAIFYHRISFGGVETNIKILSDILINHGFSVTLIIEEKTVYDVEINPAVKVVLVPASTYTVEGIKAHLSGMQKALADVDILLYFAWLSPMLLWDLMLSHFMRIPLIVAMRGCFSYSLIDRGIAYSNAARISVYKCADKAICLSTFTEKYFRSFGIDVQYLPNPILPNCDNHRVDRENNMLFVARLDDPVKRIRQALQVLRQVNEYLPQTKLYIAGGFSTEKRLANFYGWVAEYGLFNNIIMLGWVDNTREYMSRCKVFLSTSYSEGFPNAIADSQAMGTPCVMYDLPVMIAENNEGIIKVAQGDYIAAAKAVVELLTDDKKWQLRSHAAVDTANRFTPKYYSQNILKLFASYNTESTISDFSSCDYEQIIRSLIFYGGQSLPVD